jgi:hypothetical protein
MDWGFPEKAQLQTTISMERDVVNYLPKLVGAVYFSTVIYGSKLKRSKWIKDFYSI